MDANISNVTAGDPILPAPSVWRQRLEVLAPSSRPQSTCPLGQDSATSLMAACETAMLARESEANTPSVRRIAKLAVPVVGLLLPTAAPLHDQTSTNCQPIRAANLGD